MMFLRSLAILESRTSKLVCNSATVIVFDVFSSAIDYVDSISLTHIIASIGRLAPEETPPPLLKFIRQIQKFPQSDHPSNSSFSVSFFWKVWLLHRNTRTFRCCLGSPGHPVLKELFEMDKQAVTRCCKRTRAHSFNYSGTTSTQSSTTRSCRFGLVFFHVHPLQHWRINVLHLADAASVNFRLQSEELLPAEYSTSVVRHPAFHSTEKYAPLALQKKMHCGSFVFLFPNCDTE